MSPYEIPVEVTAAERIEYFEPSALDINEAVRALAASRAEACRRRNITITLELAAALPQPGANFLVIRDITGALFDYVQNAVQQTRLPSVIVVRTAMVRGRVLCSIGYSQSAAIDFGSPELTACAETVLDNGGDLYAWKPNLSERAAINVELPA